MSSIDPVILRVLAKTSLYGLILNVLIPISGAVGLAVLTEYEAPSSGGFLFDFSPLSDWTLIPMAIFVLAGVLVIIRIRRVPPIFAQELSHRDPDDRFAQTASRLSIIIFSINLSFSLPGLALFFIGASFEASMLFFALTLVGYQIFRPRLKFLENLRQKTQQL